MVERFSYYELMYSFIGAFFGFLFAIIMQRIFDRYAERKKKKTLLMNLCEELSKISGGVGSNIDAQGQLMYDTTVWAAVISTGYILDLLQSMPSVYKDCIVIYNKIHALEVLELRDDYKVLESQIKTLRNDIVKSIDKLFDDENMIKIKVKIDKYR